MAQSVGLQQGSYSDVERGKVNISPGLLKKLVQVYNINTTWLYTGAGDMIVQDQPPITTTNVEEPDHPYITNKDIVTVTLDTSGNTVIPMLNIQASAGWAGNAQNPQYMENRPAVSLPMPEYRQGDWVLIQTRGDSMEPTLHHGQWLMCRRIYEPNEIKDNNVYVVLLKDGPVVKRVLNRIKKRGTLVLQSDNPTYGLVEVSMVEDVLQVWSVQMAWVFDLHNRTIDIMREIQDLKEEIMLIKRTNKKDAH